MEKFDRSLLAQNQQRADEYHRRLMSPEGADALAWLADRGITQGLALKYYLGLADGLYDGRIAIPSLRPSGVVWVNYRGFRGEAPKYKAPGEKHLYNTAALDIADETGEIYICEGEFDAIVATELCGLPAVGVPGATQWTGNAHWRELFVGYQRVWVLADPDEAGLAMASAILERLPAARMVSLPADVTDTYLKHGSLEGFIRG